MGALVPVAGCGFPPFPGGAHRPCVRFFFTGLHPHPGTPLLQRNSLLFPGRELVFSPLLRPSNPIGVQPDMTSFLFFFPPLPDRRALMWVEAPYITSQGTVGVFFYLDLGQFSFCSAFPRMFGVSKGSKQNVVSGWMRLKLFAMPPNPYRRPLTVVKPFAWWFWVRSTGNLIFWGPEDPGHFSGHWCSFLSGLGFGFLASNTGSVIPDFSLPPFFQDFRQLYPPPNTRP